MGSGKYGAVSGMISRMQMMENISEHMAAVKTYSYKKGVPTFEAKLAEATSGMATKAVNYSKISKETIDFSPGQLEASGSPLHVAINGDGFFQVQREDGSLGYTRKGNFMLNAEGLLVDANGRQVNGPAGEPIILNSPNVDIAQDGSIWLDAERVGQVGLFQFADNSVLQRAETGVFAPSDNTQPALHPAPQIAQNNLETSNVDMLRTTVRMTSNLRAYEALQKALMTYSKMGEKATELGLVQ